MEPNGVPNEGPNAMQDFFTMMTTWGNNMQQGGGGVNKVVEQFRKNNPPAFDGHEDALAAEEWVNELESIFRLMECTDAHKVTCAIFMLKKDARHWWESMRRAHNIDVNPIGWIRFKELFYDNYFPEPLRADKEAEFLLLKMESMPLPEYERKFESLMRFAPHLVDTEERKARRFERGLRSDIRKAVEVLDLRTYAEVVRRAQIVAKYDVPVSQETERGQGLAQKRTWGRGNQGVGQSQNGENKKPRVDETNKGTSQLCPTCGKKHAGLCHRNTGACFRCGKT